MYVGDVAAANLAAIKKGKNIIVNIGRGITTSDREMFEAIAHEAGFTEKPIYAPYRPGEIYRIALDASRARKLLGWKPTVDIKEGVRRALAEI